MTTILILTLMALVFAAVLAATVRWWRRSELRRLGLGSGADLLVASLSAGHVPARPMLLAAATAGVISLAVGFAALQLLVLHPPRLTAESLYRVPVKPLAVPPGATRVGLVKTSPYVKVVVDDSDDNVALPQDLLRQCADTEVTYVRADGLVDCLAEGSAQAKALLDRAQLRQDLERELVGPGLRPDPMIGTQGVGTSPTEAAKDMAARRPIDRYAELVYFFLTFLGVLLRTYWDGVQLRRRRKPSILTVQSVVTSLVLAIAVYALVLQSGLMGSGNLLTFSTGVFATYNGILAPVLLKDVAALRTGGPTAPAA